MNKINIHNYEAYLLDLAEGELSSADEKLLMLFLNENPELKKEFGFVNLEKVSAENIYFENKLGLKKTEILTDVTSNNFDELCISRLEGDLNNKEVVEFDNFIESNEIRKKEFSIFKLARLTIDKDEVFQNKKSLKRKEVKTYIFRKNYTAISIAASIIILTGLYLFIPKEKENINLVSETNQDAKIEKLPEIIPEHIIPKEISIKNINKIIIIIKINTYTLLHQF
jgi:hypothetical protein